MTNAHTPQQTILVVDDAPENIDVLVGLLQTEYKVKAATNGEKALNVVTSKNPPDLILLDIMMPVMDGYAVCQQLKADATTQDIPVVFMSALEETLDKVKAFQAGGVDYITKPFQAEEVVARVRTHLSLRNMQRRLQKQNTQLQQEIAERKRAETELEQANQALQHSLETLQIAQNQLVQAEKMAALGTLVAGVAHEINTPVGIGVTAASFLETKTQEIRQRYETSVMHRSDLEHYFTTASESARLILQNLRRAADQIQSFKQVAVDQVSSEERQFKIKAYIDDLLLSLHPKLKTTQHTVTIHCSEDLEITSYPGAFSQILTNLILNSLLHGFENTPQGEMVLEITRDHDMLQMVYRDNGAGITQDHQTHIFEPFYTTKRGQGHTGLGLHIVYNLVTQQLGGTIHCESTTGVGTTFVIQIPLVD